MGFLGLRFVVVCWIMGLSVGFAGKSASLPTDGLPRNLGDLVRIQQRVQAVLEVCQKATVGLGRGGSGVIVSPDGLILTAAHVSMNAGRVMTVSLLDGRRVRAKALGLNHLADAGLVKIMEPGDWPYVPLAQDGGREAGDWCFALGHPSGFDAERGAVLRVGRLIGSHALVMRTDCHLIGGDSGGPLFDLGGNVIGIHSKVSERIDENYHAPIEAFRRHWQLFLNGEEIQVSRNPEGGFLGVASELSLKGALIKKVFADTPAAAYGFKEDDVIVSIDSVAVFDSEELGWALQRNAPGSTVKIALRRGNRPMVLPVVLGKRPPSN